jgi:hypothetical protein
MLKPELCIRAHIESIKLIAQQIRAAGIAMDDEKSVERFSPFFQEVFIILDVHLRAVRLLIGL